MGRKPKRRAPRRRKGKRPNHPLASAPVATASATASERGQVKPIMVMETIRSQLAALAPLAPAKRKRTILLMEGTNALTGRPVRIYIRPDDTLVACETLGQLERPGSAGKECRASFVAVKHPWGGRPQLFCKPRCRDIYYNRERRQLEQLEQLEVAADAQRNRADAETD